MRFFHCFDGSFFLSFFVFGTVSHESKRKPWFCLYSFQLPSALFNYLFLHVSTLNRSCELSEENPSPAFVWAMSEPEIICVLSDRNLLLGNPIMLIRYFSYGCKSGLVLLKAGGDWVGLHWISSCHEWWPSVPKIFLFKNPVSIVFIVF